MLSQPTGPFNEQDIQRAITHHRRALEALRDTSTFVGIRYTTTQRLVQRLEQDLMHLEEQLERCRDERARQSVEIHAQ